MPLRSNRLGGDPMTAPTADRARESYALVQRAQAGDNEAFAEIYERYRMNVYYFLLKRTHNHDLAEDITQDTFVRAIRNISSFTRPDQDYGAWLTTVARNLLHDWRKRKTNHEVLGAEWTLSIEHTVDNGRPLEELDTALDAWTAMLLLTAAQREAVTLHHLNGWSVPAVARHMGLHEGAVKALLYRGRNAMGRTLTDLHEEAS